MKNRSKFLCSAAMLMFLFGLVRGIGGIMDLMDNQNALAGINASQIILIFSAVMLIVLTSAMIIISIGLWEQSKKYVAAAAIFITLFLVNGVVSKYFLLGRFTDHNTMINLIAALIIMTLLLLGVRRTRMN